MVRRWIHPFAIEKKKSKITAVAAIYHHNTGYLGVSFADGTWTAVPYEIASVTLGICGVNEGFGVAARSMCHVAAKLGLLTASEAHRFDGELWKTDQENIRQSQIRRAKDELEAAGYKVTSP